MGWIISMVFAVVVCTILFFVGRAVHSTGKERRGVAQARDYGFSSIGDAKTTTVAPRADLVIAAG